MCLQVVDRRVFLLLEEIKAQNQTQIVLLQQLLTTRSGQFPDNSDVQEELNLPASSLQQIMKLESECEDQDLKAKLVSVYPKF